MDQAVRDALVRWPDVPAAFGWLSLDARGQWRLHEGGDYALGHPGEIISNRQIIAFMNRNYDHDASGRWFFQNGPQRVYVRIDTAPYVLRLVDDGQLLTHTGEAAGKVSAWWLDELGRLYAMTAIGPGAVDDRDLMAVLDAMVLSGAPSDRPAERSGDAALLSQLSVMAAGDRIAVAHPCSTSDTAVVRIDAAGLPEAMGFVRAPAPPEASERSADANVR